MLVPEPTYQLAEPCLYPGPLPIDARVQLGFYSDRHSEVLSVMVAEVLEQGGVHRGQLVQCPKHFTDLQVGQIIHFRPDHVLHWSPAPRALRA